MDEDVAAAVRQVRLVLQHLLGTRLQRGSPGKLTETGKQASAATAANGTRPAIPTRSEAKASSS